MNAEMAVNAIRVEFTIETAITKLLDDIDSNLDGQIPRQLARSQGHIAIVVVGKHMKKIYSDLKEKEQELYAGAKGEAG